MVGGTCFVMEDGKHKMTGHGEPEMIIAMIEAKDATCPDNWRTLDDGTHSSRWREPRVSPAPIAATPDRQCHSDRLVRQSLRKSLRLLPSCLVAMTASRQH